jgi:small nuclear ribonucleoprotein (snRNP)-like protein
MADGKEQYKREIRRIIVKTADGATFVGKVNIGLKKRVSELFTKTSNQFIVLFDAEHSSGMGKTFFINKDHIVWVEPEE